MNRSEVPYSIATPGTDGHEFDLIDQGGTKTVFVGGIISGANPDTDHLFATHPVTREDYDKDFSKRLREIAPPNLAHAFLDHHLKHSIEKLGGASVFLDHFKYAILHPLQQHLATAPQVAAASDWFKNTMDNIHKQHRRERNYFLSEAYRVAHEHSPSSPLQVSLDPVEFGKSIGFDKAATTRIMHDLVDEGLVTSSLGMGILMVTAKGRRYLEQLHGDDDPRLNPPTVVNNNYNASGGSILQVATNSPNATQTANLGDQLSETRAFAERVTAKLDQIQQLITAEQFNSIKQELDLLKARLDDPKPRMSLIAELRSGLISGFMALPADLLAFLLGKAVGA